MPVGRPYLGKAKKRLTAVATRFGVAPATEWYGFTYNGKKVLFRYGKAEAPRQDYTYDSPIWTKPFGTQENRQEMDYVLLQADIRQEFFYLVPTCMAERSAQEFQNRSLRIPVYPQNQSGAKKIAEALEPYRKRSIDAVRLVLRGDTNSV